MTAPMIANSRPGLSGPSRRLWGVVQTSAIIWVGAYYVKSLLVALAQFLLIRADAKIIDM